MKFAHAFESALQRDDYPQRWVDAAISYRELKKCIKGVQQELSLLGLDIATLKKLWTKADGRSSQTGGFQYTFDGGIDSFKPKLIFHVDQDTGIPISASIAPATKELLKALALQDHLSAGSAEDDSLGADLPGLDISSQNASGSLDARRLSNSSLSLVREVEIHLTSDSRFFHLLNSEVNQLSTLQSQEEMSLQKSIAVLGRSIGSVTEPSSNLSRTDLYAWRDIFSLYTDSRVFFSTNEHEEFTRTSAVAQGQLQSFSDKLVQLQLPRRFKKRESHAALSQFVELNLTLLRNLRFQELNVTAMTKILKKFDKRTALGARETFPELVVADSFSSSTLAKSVCFQVSEKLLSIVPLMNDYLCPVCFNISFKPIRLKCKHIFCIRCLVVMQRAKDDHCPLCRGSVVMEADSANLDLDMMIFLKKYFPAEVKAKQRQNEHDAAIDRYGEFYDRKCALM